MNLPPANPLIASEPIANDDSIKSKFLYSVNANEELQDSKSCWSSKRCCSCLTTLERGCCCGCLNKMAGCCNAVKNKYNGATKSIYALFDSCKKCCVDKYHKKLIDDFFFKINAHDQNINNIFDPQNEYGHPIYKILEGEYTAESTLDKRFLVVMYKFVIKTFIQSMFNKSALAHAAVDVNSEDLVEWGNSLKADFQGKRLVEQDCLDMALQELRNKKSEKLDLNDYHYGFSNALACKLLKNGYYFNKDVLDEEIQNVRVEENPNEFGSKRALDNRTKYLKQMNLLDHSIESLIDLFNIIKEPKQSNKNVEMIRTIINEVINNYISNAKTMQTETIFSLLSLAFVDDVQAYKKFLNGVLNDISTQQLFDPLKITLLRKVIVIGAVSSSSKLNDDDVMNSIRLVLGQLKYLAVDDKNENLQKCMDALCDLLFVAVSYLHVIGIAKEKIQEITKPLTHLNQHGLEKIYKNITKKSSDPSLRIKYSYAMDFISGIGGTQYEKWSAAQRLLNAAFAFAFMSIFPGYITNIAKVLAEIPGNISQPFREALEDRISKFQKDIVGQNNKNVQATKEEFVKALKSYQPNDISESERWYERVNILKAAETLAMEEVFDKIYSVNCYEKHTKNESVTYYSAKLLVEIVADKNRTSYEQKDAIKGLYAIYEN